MPLISHLTGYKNNRQKWPKIIAITFSLEVVFLGVHPSYIFVQNQAYFSALIKNSAVIYNPIVGGRERKRENIIARAVWCGAN